MESDGVLTIYQRSIKKHGLRYNPYIGDGDSSSYTRVAKDAPYGVLKPLTKSECYIHVTRRMGTGLRKLIKEHKGNFLFNFKLRFRNILIESTVPLFSVQLTKEFCATMLNQKAVNIVYSLHNSSLTR